MIAAAILFWLARHSAVPSCGRIQMIVLGWGPLAPLGFVALFVLATVLFVPGTILSVSGGVLFGPWWGTFYVSAGSVLGAWLAFLIARHFARGSVEAFLEKKRWFTSLEAGFGSHPFAYLLFLRLSPVFPFNGLNYALGLLPVSAKQYVVASLVGMLPGTFAFVYAGHAIGCAALEKSGAASGNVRWKVFFALLVLSFLSLLPLVWKSLRAK